MRRSCTLVRGSLWRQSGCGTKPARENTPGNCHRTTGQRSQTDAGEPSRGRIYADVNGFLDPVDFRGQLVTVVGPITGAVDGKIGNTPYKFMVMQVTGYKRWHLTQQVIMPPQPIDPWFYGGRGWPYGYGGWGWYNPGPARVQTVVTE